MVLYIYIDFETTGLSIWHDHIVQIGAVASKSCGIDKCEKIEKLSKFETLVFTDRKICSGASEKTGIFNHKLKDAPNTKQALLSFFDWIQKLREDSEKVVFVAYNGLQYDFTLLLCEMYRWDISIYRTLSSVGVTHLLDPLKWARNNINTTCLLRKNNGKCSFCLGDMHVSLVGERIIDAHTALADTDALFTICTHDEFSKMITCTDEYCVDITDYIKVFTKKRINVDKCMQKNIVNHLTTFIKKRKPDTIQDTQLSSKIPKTN